MLKTIEVNNTKYYAFESKSQLINFIKDKATILIAINAGKLRLKDNTVKNIINQNIGYIDGVGAKIAAKKKGVPKPIKIPGCELWLDIIRENKDKRFYILGSKQNVLNKVIDKLKNDFPFINIVGYHDGYFDFCQNDDIINNIKQSKADIVFVAMGSPKQEEFMAKSLNSHKALYMGLGGSFDVYTNSVKRAPKFWIYLGLEGIYRDITQPKKYLKRAIKDYWFLIKLILGKY